jgi:serine/threonine protein kinase
MPALSTSKDFTRLLLQSGVLDEKRLEAFAQRQSRSDDADSANELAGDMVREGVLTAFQARQLLRGRWRRLTIRGKYTVLRPLGSGGTGRVYLCEHRVTGCQAAIKVLSPARSANPEDRERFYREARAITSLQHPNIVRAFDLDRAGKCYVLIMEYVSGSTLQELVEAEGPLPFSRAASHAYQAAQGLHHLHQAGLVHRDVKPANLLLDRTGTLKIIDLGLTRFLDDEGDGLTGRYSATEVLGTADYLAPEQALDTHSAGIPADIYSLGATLYFTLAGQPPFHGLTVPQKLLGHQLTQPPPIRSRRPDIPQGLAAVVDRMMAKEPSQRFQTAAEVAEALAPWMSGTDATVPLCTDIEPAPVVSRARLRWAVALLGALAAGSLGVVQLFAALRGNDLPRTAPEDVPVQPVATSAADPPPHVTLGVPQ